MDLPKDVKYALKLWKEKEQHHHAAQSAVRRLRQDADAALRSGEFDDAARGYAMADALAERVDALAPKPTDYPEARAAIRKAVEEYTGQRLGGAPVESDLPFRDGQVIGFVVRQSGRAFTPSLTSDERTAVEGVQVLAAKIAAFRSRLAGWVSQAVSLPGFVDGGIAVCELADEVAEGIPEAHESVAKALQCRHPGDLADWALQQAGWRWEGTALHGSWHKDPVATPAVPQYPIAPGAPTPMAPVPQPAPAQAQQSRAIRYQDPPGTRGVWQETVPGNLPH